MNWENKTLFVGDNLHVLRGMNSETVDLIYLDPPFNSNRSYAAPIGSRAAGAAFKDAWTLSDIDLVEHQALKENHPGLYAVIDAERYPTPQDRPTAIVRKVDTARPCSSPARQPPHPAPLDRLASRLQRTHSARLPRLALGSTNHRQQ